MAYLPMKGDPIAEVTCRACNRRVRMDPNLLPVGCQGKLRCSACGQRGASIRYVWEGGPKPENVVGFRAKRRRRPEKGHSD